MSNVKKMIWSGWLGFSGVGVVSQWILNTGFWDDVLFWVDEENWID